jgi:3-oxoacyl-[acyl-carrier-protein] synthase-3
MKYSNVYIDTFGYQLPPNVVTSDDLEDRLDPVFKTLRIQKGQVEAITGIHERRYWDPGFRVSEGAAKAGQKALENSRISAEDIDMLIYGGVCRDNLEPATACAVCDKLGLRPDIMLYDVSNACLGVLNGMVQIADAIELGRIKAGMVVSCETSRQIVDITIEELMEKQNMDLFKKSIATFTGGSGAVAVILTSREFSPDGHRLLGGVSRQASRFHRLCMWGPDVGATSRGEFHLATDSVGILQNGVKLGMETFSDFKNKFFLNDNQPDKIICHQVGATHQKQILQSLGIPAEKDFTTFRFLGNVGTVSLPITAAIANERDFLEKDDLVGFLGIASGLNCMMLAVKW